MTDQEFNIAVARKLGWRTHIAFPGRWVPPNGIKRVEEGVVSTEVHTDLPPYSTSIEAAWEIVEKFPEGYFLLIKAKGDNYWKCDIGNDGSICVVTADTAPLAICKAFLKLP